MQYTMLQRSHCQCYSWAKSQKGCVCWVDYLLIISTWVKKNLAKFDPRTKSRSGQKNHVCNKKMKVHTAHDGGCTNVQFALKMGKKQAILCAPGTPLACNTIA